MSYFLAIDIGGTSTRIGSFPSLTALDYTLLARFSTLSSYEKQLQTIQDIIDKQSEIPAGIGISFGGRMTQDGRAVLVAPNLSDYEGRSFVQQLEERYHCPVRMAHDTDCGLLAERQSGILHGERRCAYLTLSTGTGAAVYLSQGDQSLYISIEVAHQLLDGNQLLCLCGQVGCIETYTGGRQLEQRLGHSLASVDDPLVWSQMIEKLTLGLINLVHLTRVETIAVGGAIAIHRPALISDLQMLIQQRLRGATLRLRPASLEEHAPLVGAAQLLAPAVAAIVH